MDKNSLFHSGRLRYGSCTLRIGLSEPISWDPSLPLIRGEYRTVKRANSGLEWDHRCIALVGRTARCRSVTPTELVKGTMSQWVSPFMPVVYSTPQLHCGQELGYRVAVELDQLFIPSRSKEVLHWSTRSMSSFPIQIEAPINKILRRLRERGIISSRRPWPIHVACLTNVSDGDIVNWSAGIALSPMSYYRCRDNLYQVRTIVDHQIRWSAIFTLAHKHKSSARNIINPK